SSFVSEEFLVNISPVGIKDPQGFQNLAGLRAYPNPNTGNFTLEMEVSEIKDIQINITNILGQSVYAATLNNIKGKYTNQINLKPNPAGIYNLQIQYDKNMINKKIILQKQ
ncbi:MAG: T9SS type A sorting domain-containing protein, partial [Cytophagales bacterium]|nr:T9SS type A sorting domain-containing protein [Cytophagales bacterium]